MENPFKRVYLELLERFRRALLDLGEDRLSILWRWERPPREGENPFRPAGVQGFRYLCHLRLPPRPGDTSYKEMLDGIAWWSKDGANEEQLEVFRKMSAEAGSAMPLSFVSELDSYRYFPHDEPLALWCAFLFRVTGYDVFPPCGEDADEVLRGLVRPFSTSMAAIQACGLHGDTPKFRVLEDHAADEEVASISMSSTGTDELPQLTGSPDRTEPEVVSASGRVKLYGPQLPPQIDGADFHRRLTPAEYDIIVTLINAGNRGLELIRLAEKSGRPGARQTFDKLKKAPVWGQVLQSPGSKGGMYRIL